MDHRKSINQDRHIIAVAVSCSFVLADGILVDDLKKVVMNVLLVNQGNILGRTVITLQDLDKVLLNLPGLLNDMVIRISQGIFENRSHSESEKV